MQTAGRRRTRWAIAASALAHAVLLVGVLLYRPHLTSPVELAAGPAETVIPVILTPRSHVAQRRRQAGGRHPRWRSAGEAAESALPAPPRLPGPANGDRAVGRPRLSPPGQAEAPAAPDIRAWPCAMAQRDAPTPRPSA